MTFALDIPRYIALCGNPGSGKSTVQEILRANYGVEPVDDGFALRKIAVEQFGLTWDQVMTQEGKRETVTVAGKAWIVRDLLGQLGNRIEDLLGPHGIPFLSERQVADKPGCFSFGSVRRDQGRFYQDRGGVVIGVRSPKAGPSEFEFDRFDEACVDLWIDNDGEDLRRLEWSVWTAIKELEARRRVFVTQITERAA
ncbi:AAA family ATPase [Methylorubrum extorquens]|uniref:AAA family ATPase n=1 Tax=Methylorubrum extorquens TaxID=408 RepID=UPI0020A03740|nr:AAA family ATPase [Methylorubrum extorquens]MCP1540083.1 hypothetical protein [Methylorubrum extorquens]